MIQNFCIGCLSMEAMVGALLEKVSHWQKAINSSYGIFWGSSNDRR